MDNQQTCGQGLAEHSALPAKMGELIDALADNLELHRKTLDLSDDNAKLEDDAYARLSHDYRRIARQLLTTAERMAGYRNLPMARHDELALSDPKLVEAFDKYVRVERELFALLETALARDETMLQAMPK